MTLDRNQQQTFLSPSAATWPLFYLPKNKVAKFRCLKASKSNSFYGNNNVIAPAAWNKVLCFHIISTVERLQEYSCARDKEKKLSSAA